MTKRKKASDIIWCDLPPYQDTYITIEGREVKPEELMKDKLEEFLEWPKMAASNGLLPNWMAWISRAVKIIEVQHAALKEYSADVGGCDHYKYPGVALETIDKIEEILK